MRSLGATRRKLPALPAFARALGAAPRSFRSFARYGATLERHHIGAEPHWYLVVLSVRPEYQRRGLGTRLVEPVLDRADRDGVACWLETSDLANVAYHLETGARLMAKAYWINLFRSVRDPEKVAEYIKLAGPVMQRSGGRFLARGEPQRVFEAGVTERTVVIEFDSIEQAVAAYESADYQAALQALGDGAERDLRIIEALA